MIRRSDILSIPFLKKSVFTGSYKGMRYRLGKQKQDEAESLQVVIWNGPYNFDVTKEEMKEYQEFPFSEEGVCQAVDWLNEKWKQQKDIWQKNNFTL